ncbi:MAG: FAD:protein FMN transferase [Ghiorsea sp.]
MKFFLVIGLVLFSLVSCQQQAHDVKETSFLLGTIVEFTIYTDKDELALKAIKDAATEMQHIEDIFTTFGEVENSVKQFNRVDAGETVKLNAEVERLLIQSIQINEKTMGSFDPTLGVLNSLWGFSGYHQSQQPPSDKLVQTALSQSGVENIERTDKGWLKKKSGIQLDFGAIAKGYAIDKSITILKKYGFTQAIINAGGDIAILGSHGKQPWRIAIRHPREKKPLGWLEVRSDTSIVTSGDYERFYMYKNNRYHHILDPITGYPSSKSQSVTVVAENATLADAWSTGLFVLGNEQGKALLKKRSDIEALWVDDTGQVKQTSKILLHHETRQ